MTFDDGRAHDAQKIVAPSKYLLIDFTPKLFCEKKSQKFFPTSKNEMLQIVWNAFSQSFAPIQALFEG